jgi:hypothetical protein
MKLPNYPLASSDDMKIFQFVSEGTKGLIIKKVQFTATNVKPIFNLAFGDKDEKTGEIDDQVISNNGDSEKVLATVVATIYAFTDKNKDAWIYATGSTKARTRLYRIGIAKYLEVVQNDFEILGELEEDWEIFQKDKEYLGFIVRRK